MSVLYCTIPHFAIALARRDGLAQSDRPLVLIGPDGRVFDASPEAAARYVAVGMTARMAETRCPEAVLAEADLPACRSAFEALLQTLEQASPAVEPHGWGAAYADLRGLACRPHEAAVLCVKVGRSVRRALGEALQPALGWDSGKFTAQMAARRTHPGHVRALDADEEHPFLDPLPVSLLPLDCETVRRLGFLGLRTLGQYAALPPAAVAQQFGRAGQEALRLARGEDGRPVISRRNAPILTAQCSFEPPVVDRERALAALDRRVRPLLDGLAGRLQACGLIRLTAQFDRGRAGERTRALLYPTADAGQVTRALAHMLDQVCTPHQGVPPQGGIEALAVTLADIREVVLEQLRMFPDEDDRMERLAAVQRYLAARFGRSGLRRAALVRPAAPLPEWRVAWRDEALE